MWLPLCQDGCFSLPARPTSRGELRLRADLGWASGQSGILRAARIIDDGFFPGMNIFKSTTSVGVKKISGRNFNFYFRLQSCLS